MVRRVRIVRAFVSAGATTSQAARDPDELGITRGLIFRRMVKGGVLREEAGGRFWLDEAADAAFRRCGRWALAVVLCIAVVVIVTVVLLTR